MAARVNRKTAQRGCRSSDLRHGRVRHHGGPEVQRKPDVRTRFLSAVSCAAVLLAQRPPVEDAWDLLAKGERAQAIQLLHGIIKANPRDADARLLLGSVLAEQGERSESIAQLTEGVRLRPQSAAAHNALGEAFNTFHDMKAARGAFEKAAALDPGFAQARVNLGLVLVDSGEFGSAAEHLDRAIRILGH